MIDALAVRRADPQVPSAIDLMRGAGLEPDSWQCEFLVEDHPRSLLLAARQSGKSQTVACKVLHKALTKPRTFVLLLSPSLRQSGELFRERLLPLWLAAGQPLKLKNPTQLELRLANGSRIISLPESEGTIRGFSGVTDLVIDEAARVADELYRTVRPMLAVRKGSLIALTTPFGQRGWFYEEWASQRSWHRVKIVASECPRLDKDFLEQERASMGEVWCRQEYECQFGALFGALWPEERFNNVMFEGYPVETDGFKIIRRVLAVDTSRGADELADWQAFIFVSHANDGSFWVDAELVKLDDLKLYEKALELIRRWSPDVTVVETAFAGYVLFSQLARAKAVVLGRPRPSTSKKYDRISTRLTPLWNAGSIHIKNTPGGREVLDQARQFPIPDSHDDGPDALEMGIELCQQLILPARHPAKIRYELGSEVLAR
jgi:hypothetical protein